MANAITASAHDTLPSVRAVAPPGSWYHSAMAPQAPETKVAIAATAMSAALPIIPPFVAISFPGIRPRPKRAALSAA
jgi:hypothetical protein